MSFNSQDCIVILTKPPFENGHPLRIILNTHFYQKKSSRPCIHKQLLIVTTTLQSIFLTSSFLPNETDVRAPIGSVVAPARIQYLLQVNCSCSNLLLPPFIAGSLVSISSFAHLKNNPEIYQSPTTIAVSLSPIPPGVFYGILALRTSSFPVVILHYISCEIWICDVFSCSYRQGVNKLSRAYTVHTRSMT
ncbi:hypothetical protein SAY86_023449 [Trapa natans]|uniref:Uncharacterized protein n=1 Tax=Trapa natans TaxID=22666 RepID=A0AAN7LVS5_TRANT|nr:hypothetical protein SAY86_023449 [Trapa natans]